MKSMKKLLSGETSPILDCGSCGDFQFHAALNMEAGSRTPLPPSSNTLKSLIPDSTTTSMTNVTTDLEHKLKFKPALPDLPPPVLLPLKPQVPPEMTLSKAMPSKPPRKYIPVNKVVNDPEYEPVDRSYDEIEYRNNAWQTLGVDSPSHTEQVGDVFSGNIDEVLGTLEILYLVYTRYSPSNLLF